MSSINNMRSFLLGTYHDLPNVLFIGSLLLGAIMGYLPLVWVALGLIINGAIVAALQGLLSFMFPTWSQVAVPANSIACDIFAKIRGASVTASKVTYVAPSYWVSAVVFFATFSVYNSVRILFRAPTQNAPQDKIDNRRAFSLSTLVIGLSFLGFVFTRGFTGCETWLGGVLGTIVGAGTAIGFWHILDACGTGGVPDILQVVGSMAPEGSDVVPIICSPSPPQ